MSFNIFAVTYRVTSFLPKVVYMLLFYSEKTEFPCLEFPIFGYCLSSSTQILDRCLWRWPAQLEPTTQDRSRIFPGPRKTSLCSLEIRCSHVTLFASFCFSFRFTTERTFFSGRRLRLLTSLMKRIEESSRRFKCQSHLLHKEKRIRVRKPSLVQTSPKRAQLQGFQFLPYPALFARAAVTHHRWDCRDDKTTSWDGN